MGSFFAHETAIVESPYKIEKGTEIWHFSHIMPGVQIGDECNIGQNVVIASGVKIGNKVKIKNNVSIYSVVTIEDYVSCGPSVVLTDATNTRGHILGKHESKKAPP